LNWLATSLKCIHTYIIHIDFAGFCVASILAPLVGIVHAAGARFPRQRNVIVGWLRSMVMVVRCPWWKDCSHSLACGLLCPPRVSMCRGEGVFPARSDIIAVNFAGFCIHPPSRVSAGVLPNSSLPSLAGVCHGWLRLCVLEYNKESY
jgi:hypothetical protein